MTEPIDLMARRAERRQQLRDESPDVLVALPDTDSDLTRALAGVEEVLLLVDADDDDEQALPAT